VKPTIEILENVKRNSEKNKEEVFTKLYRYMLRPDLYYVAYQNLYANNGASTKGINDDTADGFSEEKITKIIKSLADETYKPSPARRTYIKKENGKMRPLGIPTFTDKLVQEVLRMVLESVYEPIFLETSHGFRPNKSCHTALKSIKNGFNGVRWFIEGDIKGCFDNINHAKLVEFIGTKIKDARLVKLIWKFLKAGYMEGWKYNATYSGTPQGGIVSPIFANIYLHELDKFAKTLAENFNKPAKQKYTDEYNAVRREMERAKSHLKKATGDKKAELLKLKNELRAKLLKTPSKSQTDKKLKYVRYADDFLIGVNGSREDCGLLKQMLSEFISGTLKMELSEEKTLITHSNEYARFLGYDVRVRRNGQIKPAGKDGVKRTLSNVVELNIPLDDKIMKFLFNKGVIRQNDGKIYPTHRNKLLHCTELEVVATYNSEIRGICNYYSLASNFNKLNYFAYLMEYSCLKTLAAKHKSTCSKEKRRYKDGKGGWGIPYKTKSGEKRCNFAKYAECKKSKYSSDIISNTAVIHSCNPTTFESRITAKTCELCGTTEAKHYEVHHVNKLKNLKGKALWEQAMIAKRRKTLVLCRECHHKIHNNRVS
jgi:group II intron reverse transcriptase/maturase